MRIKGFSKFQHFKDRNPPWVKLYRDILDDPDWHDLDPVAAKILVMLWLIASEDDTKQGRLPCNKKLAFRLRINEKQLEQSLNKLSHWLVHDDIELISDRNQSDAPETETETDKETDILVASKLPTCPHQEVLFLFSEELPELPQPRVWEGSREKDLSARWKWVLDHLKKKGKAQTKEEGLEFFRRMFAYIRDSDFLMGKSSSWSCDIGWIMKANNFAKIIEGNYHKEVA
ncbi:MAG TPA: hypothetical protein VFH31_05335 [Pyrinomonadaceae bacterium]|nr:hypothetical protein [Pyrinomonadaceae bacterium]